MTFSWWEFLVAALFVLLVLFVLAFGDSNRNLKRQIMENEPIKLEKNVYMCSQVAL